MDIKKEIIENRSLILILDEEYYENNIDEIMLSLQKIKKNICYVCMNKKYTDIIEVLKEKNINTEKIFFIDVLSTHYISQEPNEKCIFVPSPDNLPRILEAMNIMLTKNKCDIFIFDTLSTLLIYETPCKVLRFVDDMLKMLRKHSRKTLIALQGGDILSEEREKLINDVKMFVEKSVEIKIE